MKFCSCGKNVNKKCACSLKTYLKPTDFWDPCTIKKYDKANWANNFCKLRKQWSNISKYEGSSAMNACSNCIDKKKSNFHNKPCCNFHNEECCDFHNEACCYTPIDTYLPHLSSTCLCSTSTCCPYFNCENQCRCVDQVSTTTNSFDKNVCSALDDLLKDLASLTNQIRLGLQTIDNTRQEITSEMSNALETSIGIVENIISLSQETCTMNEDLKESYNKLTNLKEKLSLANDTEAVNCINKKYNTLKQMTSVIQNIADQNKNDQKQIGIESFTNLQVPDANSGEVNGNIDKQNRSSPIRKSSLKRKSHLKLKSRENVNEQLMENKSNQNTKSTISPQKSSKSFHGSEGPMNESYSKNIIQENLKPNYSQSKKTSNIRRNSSKSRYKPELLQNDQLDTTPHQYRYQSFNQKSVIKIENPVNKSKQNIPNMEQKSQKSLKSFHTPEISQQTLKNNHDMLKKSTFQKNFSKSALKMQSGANINEQIVQNIPNQKRKSLNFVQKSSKSLHKPRTLSEQLVQNPYQNRNINSQQISSESLLNVQTSDTPINEQFNDNMKSSHGLGLSTKSIYKPETVINEQYLDNIPEQIKKKSFN